MTQQSKSRPRAGNEPSSRSTGGGDIAYSDARSAAPAGAKGLRYARLGRPRLGRQGQWIASITALCFVAFPLIDVWLGGTRRLIGYFAADAFYYLTVARNIAQLGFPTSDQVRATNGFHPLWQFFLAGLYSLVHGLGFADSAMLWFVFAIELAALGAAILLIARAFIRADGELHPLFALLPVGLFGFIAAPLWIYVGDRLNGMNPFEGSTPVWGTPWFAINGMETPFLLLAWALLLYWITSRDVVDDIRSGAVLGIIMAALVLTRLDHAPFAIVTGLYLLPALFVPAYEPPAGRLRGVGIAAAAIVAAIPLALYVASNRVYFGGPVPISGALKSTFPHPTLDNAANVVELLAAQLPGWWLERAARALQMIIPALTALTALAWLPRPRAARLALDARSRRDAVLLGAAWSILSLSVYNFAFVKWVHQGHWYYPLSTLFVSLIALRVIPQLAKDGWRRARSVAIFAVCLATSTWFFWSLHRQPEYHTHYADFLLLDAARVRELLSGRDARVVEFDDGIIGWGTGFPSMPASGLTLDPEGAREVHEGRLFSLAIERDHRFISSSIVGVDGVWANARSSLPQRRSTIIYRSENGFFGVVEVEPDSDP